MRSVLVTLTALIKRVKKYSMAITVEHIIGKLSEYSHRGATSENEMFAREEILAMLTGINGLDFNEEAFFAPATPFIHLWVLVISLCLCLSALIYSPLVSLVGSFLFGGSIFLFFDDRKSRLFQIFSQYVTANVTAKRVGPQASLDKRDCPVFILCASLDSPAMLSVNHKNIVHYKRYIIYFLMFMLMMGAVLSIIALSGFAIPTLVTYVLIVPILALTILYSYSYWILGYSAGINNNLSSTAAMVTCASRLFYNMPATAEVRLLLTSGDFNGNLGIQEYFDTHEDDLKGRPIYFISAHGVGAGDLSIVKSAGNLIPTDYHGHLIKQAYLLSREDERFQSIKLSDYAGGGLNSLTPLRDQIETVSLAGLDEAGLIKTLGPLDDHKPQLNIEQIVQATDFVENLVWRMTDVHHKLRK